MSTPNLFDLARRVETMGEVLESLIDERKPSRSDMTAEEMVDAILDKQLAISEMMATQIKLLAWMQSRLEKLEGKNDAQE